MGAQVLEENVTNNGTKAAAKASTVLVEKRDGRVVDFDPINIISAIKSAFGDLNKEVGPEEDPRLRRSGRRRDQGALRWSRQDRGHPEPR